VTYNTTMQLRARVPKDRIVRLINANSIIIIIIINIGDEFGGASCLQTVWRKRAIGSRVVVGTT